MSWLLIYCDHSLSESVLDEFARGSFLPPERPNGVVCYTQSVYSSIEMWWWEDAWDVCPQSPYICVNMTGFSETGGEELHHRADKEGMWEPARQWLDVAC